MGPTKGYQPRNEQEAIEFDEYKKLWKNKGLAFTHLEERHEKRVKYIRMALKRGSPLKEAILGKLSGLKMAQIIKIYHIQIKLTPYFPAPTSTGLLALQ